MKSLAMVAAVSAALHAPALGQAGANTFKERDDGAKIHRSGFVCPQKIGPFERDAAGEADTETNSDFCAYSDIGGVYGTIKLTPLTGNYDPKASLASDFGVQEATGGQRIAEKAIKLERSPLSIYTRTYSTAHAETLEYRILFAGAALRGWAVEVTVEYADPRDAQTEAEFLHAIYAAAARQIAK